MYAAEGSVHLYSSEPIVLTPAGLYDVKSDEVLRQAVSNCNLYMVAARRRILVASDELRVAGNYLHGWLLVQHLTSFRPVPFRWHLPQGFAGEAQTATAQIDSSGTQVLLKLGTRSTLVASHVIVAQAASELEPSETDLEVVYVGQGIGRLKDRTAVDRLLRHSTFQRIMADTMTLNPGCELLILLYRFEFQKTFISSGGDLNAEPLSTNAEERAHLDRMSNVTLSRRAKVAMAEAALIRYFQPCFNTQLKSSNFSARNKISVLEQLINKDMTGLIVEVCTRNIRSRLHTRSAPPMNLANLFAPEVLQGTYLETPELKQQWEEELYTIAHSHYATFPLTTAEERDTFMHGMVWRDRAERQPFMKMP
jgi:hypothetical protein